MSEIDFKVLDIGVGNINAIVNSFLQIGVSVSRIYNVNELKQNDFLVLPGVCSFDRIILALHKTNSFERLQSLLNNQEIGFLGICAGMQILFETSDEGICEGLGVFKGNVELIQNKLCSIVPNIGWDTLNLLPNPESFIKVDHQRFFYFSHSYACPNIDEKTTISTYSFTNMYASG